MVAWLQRLCFLVSTAHFDDLMAAAQLHREDLKFALTVKIRWTRDVWVSLHLDAVFCFDAAVSFHTARRPDPDANMQQADRRLTPPFCCFAVVFEDGSWRGHRSVIRAESIWTVFTLEQGFTLFFYTEPCANISSAVLIKRTWISVKASGEVGEWWWRVLAGSSGKRTAVALLLRLSLKWL